MDRQYWALLSNASQSSSINFAETVQKYEECGFAGLEIAQLYGPPFVPLAAAAMITSRIQLGSGIAMGLTRSPFETAMATIDLDRLSQGRFVLGLGTGPANFTSGYFGMPYNKPVSRLREVVNILRHVEEGAWSGSMKPWHGEFFNLDFHGYEPTLAPYRKRVPVWIAALRGAMCELAGEVADGLIGHPIWSVEWALGQAQEWLATGAARAGRDASEIGFRPWVAVSIDRDRKAATQGAKPHVAYYASFAQYHDYFEAHGFGREARNLQEASKTMRPLEASTFVPDEMAQTFVACGTPDQVRERIEPLWTRASAMQLFTPKFGLTPEHYAAKLKMLGDAFFGGG